MKFYFKFLFLFMVLLFFSRISYATHARAGEIIFRQLSLYTYEIEVIYYTEATSLANRDNIDLYFGDNTMQNVPLTKRYLLPNCPPDQPTLFNSYRTTHTYPGPGTYVIEFYDPNRIDAIRNMANSVNTPFYVETQLTISPFMGNNRSPILLQPPIDLAEAGQIWVHNPNAYDPDGDSLVFSFITPQQAKGVNVDSYYLPVGKRGGFTINKHTGQVIWDYPDTANTVYNIAILVQEFRHKKRIGYIIRDMQIWVVDGNNIPPLISPLPDTCIEAGNRLELKVNAYDPDSKQTITLTADGGPFRQTISPAVSNPNPAYGNVNVYSNFAWNTACEHIRKEPYLVVYKAIDNHEKPLADLKCFQIRVVGPAPENLQTTISPKGVQLNWSPPSKCSNARGYYVYRKIDSSGWDTSRCETGIPKHTGFRLIDTTIGVNSTSFFDDDRGNGLIPGVEYCYRVTAVYLNEGNYEVTEGYASNEVCAKLRRDVPVITHADVLKTDNSNGKIFIDWVKPDELDTNIYTPPYKYKILHADNINLSNPSLVKTITAPAFYELNTISFSDSMLNSVGSLYAYKVEFYSTDNGNEYLIGSTKLASSVFLSISPTHKSNLLSWTEKVPWTNYLFTIYRLNDVTGVFDSIGYSTDHNYKDSGLINGQTYCYKVKSWGSYGFKAGYVHPILNFSEEVCAFPVDTIKPCPPTLQAKADCDKKNTQLNWRYYGDSACASDITNYRIYFSKQLSHNYELIKDITNINQHSYLDYRNELSYSLAGCYVITAVDSYDNESPYSNEVCVDNCPVYELPNVFTPNNDGINDTLVPLNGAQFIEKIHIVIYNRWGGEVFRTDDPHIRWDGKERETHEDCSEGTYFYVCEIYEIYLDGTKVRAVSGTITIFR